MSEVILITFDGGEILGVAADEKIAIRIMTDYVLEAHEKNWWFTDESEYTLEDALADIKLNLCVEGYLFTEFVKFWGK